ncbi:nuclear pore complex protein Nup50, partial [Culex quinquefasciatus]|uniref:nuclear pore complex protein Nup50 n=1 Tax=Culex quinquefasciatus TaxID=7176 RepID=UPI0018E2FA60
LAKLVLEPRTAPLGPPELIGDRRWYRRVTKPDTFHGNWNEEDAAGRFAQTSEDELKKRIIKTMSPRHKNDRTPGVDPTEVGASPFSLLIGIAKSTNGTAATKSAMEASIFASTDPSKVFFGFGSSPKENTAGSAGKDTGDETTTTNKAAAPIPFSFGFGSTSSTPRTGFIFANVAKSTEDSKPDEKASADDDEVEFTPVKEKDSIFSKRFKLFVKTDGNYSDRDIGTLHIKKVDGKVQVLVRADTSIGQILLNIILNEAVPVQGMGKNNVIMVCVPTPETKPSVLLPAKNGEEADDLYETLNKYKQKIKLATLVRRGAEPPGKWQLA